MTFLPIQFSTKFKKDEYGELDSSVILDIIQNYLNEKGYNYVERKNNKLAFHKLNGLSSLKLKSIFTVVIFFTICILIKDSIYINLITFGVFEEALVITPISYKILGKTYNNYENIQL